MYVRLGVRSRVCWGNPVKHGYVTRAVDWPYSSVHREMRAGMVPPEWGGDVEGAFGER
jgi:putative transposase